VGVSEVGLSEHVGVRAAVGETEHVRFTLPAKPSNEVAVIDTVADCPSEMELGFIDAGALTLKSLTVRFSVASVAETVEEVPVTEMV
jgi:3-dehydroquinate dehydratase